MSSEWPGNCTGENLSAVFESGAKIGYNGKSQFNREHEVAFAGNRFLKEAATASEYSPAWKTDWFCAWGNSMKQVEVTEALLKQMVEVIVDKVDPEQVILFGSHARGDAYADSDVDLVIVESDPFDENRDRRSEAVRLWRALAHFAVPKDILVYSRDEVEYWRDSINNVLARALREGRVLYERP